MEPISYTTKFNKSIMLGVHTNHQVSHLLVLSSLELRLLRPIVVSSLILLPVLKNLLLL